MENGDICLEIFIRINNEDIKSYSGVGKIINSLLKEQFSWKRRLEYKFKVTLPDSVIDYKYIMYNLYDVDDVIYAKLYLISNKINMNLPILPISKLQTYLEKSILRGDVHLVKYLHGKLGLFSRFKSGYDMLFNQLLTITLSLPVGKRRNHINVIRYMLTSTGYNMLMEIFDSMDLENLSISSNYSDIIEKFIPVSRDHYVLSYITYISDLLKKYHNSKH